MLAQVFARAAAERFGLEGVTLAPELVDALARRAYPGNVRKLENLVTRLVALGEGRPIGADALEQPDAPPAPGGGGSFRERVERLERSLLTQALAAGGSNQSEAARKLGLSRATFLDKLKRYGID